MTVVIPAFNAEATLGAALASLASQAVQPTTVVVIDDGSTDRTVDVAASWSEMLPVRLLLQERTGPGPARRAGVDATDDDLIALLDADDVWLPDHLETLLRVHERHGGIATADAFLWSPGEPLGLETYRSSMPLPPPTLQPTRILHGNFVFIGSLFARRDYDAAGGFRDLAPGAEDWDLWIRMIRAGARAHGASHPTCLYRISPGGLTAKPDIMDRYAEVLAAAIDEADTDDERAAASWGLRTCLARRELRAAYGAAREGDRAMARRRARGGLRGTWLDRLQAALLIASPKLALGLRNRLIAR